MYKKYKSLHWPQGPLISLFPVTFAKGLKLYTLWLFQEFHLSVSVHKSWNSNECISPICHCVVVFAVVISLYT